MHDNAFRVHTDEIKTPRTHPDHEIVGKFWWVATDSRVYRCIAYDPRLDYVFESVDDPRIRTTCTPRALHTNVRPVEDRGDHWFVPSWNHRAPKAKVQTADSLYDSIDTTEGPLVSDYHLFLAGVRAGNHWAWERAREILFRPHEDKTVTHDQHVLQLRGELLQLLQHGPPPDLQPGPEWKHSETDMKSLEFRFRREPDTHFA